MSYVYGRILIVLMVLAVASGSLFALSALAHPLGEGTTIMVSSTNDAVADDGLCTLREAITAANNDAVLYPGVGECPAGNGADTVLLTNGVYGIRIEDFDRGDENNNDSGDFDIRGDLTIRGISTEAARVSGRERDRVFHIHPSSEVHLETLRVIDGHTEDGLNGAPGTDGESGGGILNEGTLRLIGVVVEDNETGKGGDANFNYARGGSGGSGGGIYNFRGTLALTDSRVSYNRTGDAGDGIAFPNAAGRGGSGAGIFNKEGAVSVWSSAVSHNEAGHGANVTLQSNDPGGTGGEGAGIFHLKGFMAIRHSEISYNRTGDGGLGLPDFWGSGGSGTAGGIFNVDSMVIEHSLVHHNTTGDGNRSGDGAGIYTSGVLTLTDSSVAYNQIGVALGGSIDSYGGRGAGIAVAEWGVVSIVRSAIMDNHGGISMSQWITPPGDGGGIHSFGTITVTASTIANNEAGADSTQGKGGGVINAGPHPFIIQDSTIVNNMAERGGGVFNEEERDLRLRNSILANNNATTKSDCAGTLTSNGYVLIKDSTDCVIVGDATGNQLDIDPLLGNLITPTDELPYFPLLADSPALDAGNCSTSVTDQLHRPRPIDVPTSFNIRTC